METLSSNRDRPRIEELRLLPREAERAGTAFQISLCKSRTSSESTFWKLWGQKQQQTTNNKKQQTTNNKKQRTTNNNKQVTNPGRLSNAVRSDAARLACSGLTSEAFCIWAIMFSLNWSMRKASLPTTTKSGFVSVKAIMSRRYVGKKGTTGEPTARKKKKKVSDWGNRFFFSPVLTQIFALNCTQDCIVIVGIAKHGKLMKSQPMICWTKTLKQRKPKQKIFSNLASTWRTTRGSAQYCEPEDQKQAHKLRCNHTNHKASQPLQPWFS